MKIKLVLLMAIFSLAIGFAYAENYQARINVFPTGAIVTNEGLFVFGDVSLLESSTSISPYSLKIEVQDSTGSLVNTYFPDYVTHSGDSKYLEDGFFVKNISLGSGSYLLKLKIGDETKAIKSVDVSNFGTRAVAIKLLDYSIYQNRLKIDMRLTNLDNNSRTYTVYLISDTMANPLTFNVNIDAGASNIIEKEYDLSQFGSGNFLIVAQAKDISNSDVFSSNADALTVYSSSDTGTSSGRNLAIVNLTFPEQLYAGDLVEGNVNVKNYGSAEAQYKFEYIINNAIFRRGDVSYVQPGHTNEEKFFLDVPEGNMFYLTVRIITPGYELEKNSNYLIAERTKAYSLVLSDYSSIVFAGNSTTFNATIANRGNQEDSYRVKILNWFDNQIEKDLLILQPNRLGNVQIRLNTFSDNIIGEYPLIINVCNTEDACLNKTFTLKITKPEKDQNLVTFDDKQLTKQFSLDKSILYNITVKNIGISDKNYALSFEPDCGSKQNFVLAPQEEKVIGFSITPVNNTNQNVTVYLAAQNTTIFSKELSLVYKENTGLLTGMFIFEGDGYKPGLYALVAIGLVSISYLVYTYVSKKTWTERVLDYNQNMQQRLY